MYRGGWRRSCLQACRPPWRRDRGAITAQNRVQTEPGTYLWVLPVNEPSVRVARGGAVGRGGGQPSRHDHVRVPVRGARPQRRPEGCHAGLRAALTGISARKTDPDQTVLKMRDQGPENRPAEGVEPSRQNGARHGADGRFLSGTSRARAASSPCTIPQPFVRQPTSSRWGSLPIVAVRVSSRRSNAPPSPGSATLRSRTLAADLETRGLVHPAAQSLQQSDRRQPLPMGRNGPSTRVMLPGRKRPSAP